MCLEYCSRNDRFEYNKSDVEYEPDVPDDDGPSVWDEALKEMEKNYPLDSNTEPPF